MPEYRPPRFTYISAGDRYEVIGADDGRAVAIRSTAQSANGTAVSLTQAAQYGPKVLAKALSYARTHG